MKTILYDSYKDKEYIYDVVFPEFLVLIFYLKIIRMFWNFKTAMLLIPFIIPENFNPIR